MSWAIWWQTHEKSAQKFSAEFQRRLLAIIVIFQKLLIQAWIPYANKSWNTIFSCMKIAITAAECQLEEYKEYKNFAMNYWIIIKMLNCINNQTYWLRSLCAQTDSFFLIENSTLITLKKNMLIEVFQL